MVSALLVIVVNFAGLISVETFDKYHLMFWMETVAVVSFGVSWLIKAEVILKDDQLVFITKYVASTGIEPVSGASETLILSIVRRGLV